jgi:hypothetical protein
LNPQALSRHLFLFLWVWSGYKNKEILAGGKQQRTDPNLL